MRAFAAVLCAVAAGCSATPRPCRYVAGAQFPCPICRLRDELAAQGERIVVPSFRRGPREEGAPRWSGESLPAEPPDPSTYVRCRPCTCSARGRIEPWDDWASINRRTYEHLRTASAAYAVAIVPGFHAGGPIAHFRLLLGMRLLKQGWVAALILSGGHRRSGRNEAKLLLDEAVRMGAELGVDPVNRMFVEPCACRTVTNLRNALRMMAAMRLRSGLLVTDAKMSAQAAVFSSDLDELADRDLRCPVGRVSHLRGATPLTRLTSPLNGCRAPFSLRDNPVTFLLPRREPVVYWVSPFSPTPERELSALECGPGSPQIRACEPDMDNPFTAACLPALGATDLACSPP